MQVNTHSHVIQVHQDTWLCVMQIDAVKKVTQNTCYIKYGWYYIYFYVRISKTTKLISTKFIHLTPYTSITLHSSCKQNRFSSFQNSHYQKSSLLFVLFHTKMKTVKNQSSCNFSFPNLVATLIVLKV